MLRRAILAAPALLAPVSLRAAPALVVVELFTSQSCSSCPPADAVLEDLVRRPEVLPLSWHVTYWNRLGWRDRFSLEEATARQRAYGRSLGHGQIYTPQAVVQGRRDLVGSDRRAVLSAIAAAVPAAVPLALGEGTTVTLEAGAGAGEGTLWLLGFDRRQVTAVGGGENGGRTLAHAHVVRGAARAGAWSGQAMRLSLPRPPGERLAALLQAADGGILGAAVL
jgi:hypothetical protein